ncbi:MAG: hypothetical protein HYX67_09495, partial [Candidatus Melainabacteria bacterium]|nr:hypothetical protein [Candidatus Melainabacteria bacterium]
MAGLFKDFFARFFRRSNNPHSSNQSLPIKDDRLEQLGHLKGNAEELPDVAGRFNLLWSI